MQTWQNHFVVKSYSLIFLQCTCWPPDGARARASTSYVRVVLLALVVTGRGIRLEEQLLDGALEAKKERWLHVEDPISRCKQLAGSQAWHFPRRAAQLTHMTSHRCYHWAMGDCFVRLLGCSFTPNSSKQAMEVPKVKIVLFTFCTFNLLEVLVLKHLFWWTLSLTFRCSAFQLK